MSCSVKVSHKEIILGRNPNCDIIVDDAKASRCHCGIVIEHGKCVLKDKNSFNGTRVNGVKVSEAVLKDGDVIEIAKHRFSYQNGIIYSYPDEYVRLGRKEKVDFGEFYSRSPRLMSTVKPGKIKIESPPAIGNKPQISWFRSIITMVIAVAFLAASVSSAIASSNHGSNSAYALLAPLSGATSLVFAVTSVFDYISQKKKFKLSQKKQKEKYEEYLNSIEKQVRGFTNEYRAAQTHINPNVNECAVFPIEHNSRLWERRISDGDFMCVRIGTGTVMSDYIVESPKQQLTLQNDPLLEAADKIAQRSKTIDNIPVVCDLASGGVVGIIGNKSDNYNVINNIIVQVSALHGYDEVKIALFADEKDYDEWSWIRWLPHTFDNEKVHRYIASNAKDGYEICELLKETISRGQEEASVNSETLTPFYLFIITDLLKYKSLNLVSDFAKTVPKDARAQFGFIYASPKFEWLPSNCSTIIDMRSAVFSIYSKQSQLEKTEFVPDRAEYPLERFSRSMLSIKLELSAGKTPIPNMVTFLDGIGVKKVDQINLAANWSQACTFKSISVPIGIGENDRRFEFDIHEKKHGVMGVVAGMPGSGKTEMAQTWLLSLMLKFSPSDLSFVLIDFKGTSLIQPFKNSPHLAGSISDIDTNIGRNLRALRAEIERRERVLDENTFKNINEYNKAFYAGKVKEKLPVLLIVIDEFAQFKKAYPDFGHVIDELTSKGRALGIFIILMTQKPEGVISPATEDNLKFRWCLRVANSSASREMLGPSHPEAAFITNPGRAFVKVGEGEVYEEIQSFWSGAPYRPYSKDPSQKVPPIALVDLLGRRHTFEDESTTTGFKSNKTQIDAVVEYVAKYVAENNIPSTRLIWREELPAQIALNDISDIGFNGIRWSEDSEELAPIVGLIDDPARQARYPLSLELSTDGHTIIYGAPSSGKTTFLHSLITSIAIRYSPDNVFIYAMDFGSWGLSKFSELPHCGGIVNSVDEEKFFKTINLLTEMLDARKKAFAKNMVGSIKAYREKTGEKLPYVVLVIDNFGQLLSQYPDTDQFFLRFLQEGGGYGMYIVATTGTVNSLSFKIKAYFKSSIALYQADPGDYVSIVGKTGDLMLSGNIPGRGFVRDGYVMEFQTALPCNGETEGEISSTIVKLCSLMAQAWHGTTPNVIRTMPETIPFGSVRAENIAIGLDCESIEPVSIGFSKYRTLLISGTPGSGKTNLLEVICMQLDKADSRTVVATPKGDFDSGCANGCIVCSSGDEIDKEIEVIKDELSLRKSRKESTDNATFNPIYLLFDDWDKCFAMIDDLTVKRLKSFISMGEGLGVYIIVTIGNEQLGKLHSQGEQVLNALANAGQSVVIGKSFDSHHPIDAELTYTEKKSELGSYEGYLVDDEKARKIKIMSKER